MTIRFAFASVPKDSGTFTFYRNLRSAIRPLGVEVTCVSTGRAQARLWDSSFEDDGCILLAPNAWSVKAQARAFAEWCEAEQVDVVMGINSPAILSSIPHLPERIRVLARCANGFDHGYRITMIGKDRLAGIVALTPRLRDDLIKSYGADPNAITLIPNGISPGDFAEAAAQPRARKSGLQLAFLGRLENSQKGVFHLPPMVRELQAQHLDFVLRIAGQGQHRSVIEESLSAEVESGQVEFMGQLAPSEVPAFLGGTDILLFPSHFEGCPNVLLEALMAGCVPIAWLIEGITDFILKDGETGMVCPMGDYKAVGRVIEALANDRERLRRMGISAARDARARFSNAITAASYADLLAAVMRAAPPAWVPKPWDDFRIDPNFPWEWSEPLRSNPAAKRIIAFLKRSRLWGTRVGTS